MVPEDAPQDQGISARGPDTTRSPGRSPEASTGDADPRGPSAHPVRRRRTGNETFARIYQESVGLFYEAGYHSATLRRIANRVGIETPALYNHFPSKERLLFTIVSRTMHDLIQGARSAVAEGGDPPEQLRRFMEYDVRFHGSRRIEAGVTDNEFSHLGTELRERAIGMRDEFQRMLEDILHRGLEAGSFETADVKVTAYAMLTMGSYVALWYRPGGRLSLDQIARQYAALALRMVRAM
ncbi:MAG: TetR/AcrR family transcriptional regulator [Actinomycetota bacterium]